jgi:hypothetical protein
VAVFVIPSDSIEVIGAGEFFTSPCPLGEGDTSFCGEFPFGFGGQPKAGIRSGPGKVLFALFFIGFF